MSQVSDEVREAAEWLKRERRRLGASANLVARLATLVAQQGGDPVKIHQQQISEIENAGAGRGPKRLRPWFRHVRTVFDSGLVADALGRDPGADSPPRPANDRLFLIHDEEGRLVGELRWFDAPLRR